ncbi:hypothetical protein Aduo_008458 [Ancylostoma duodenale]
MKNQSQRKDSSNFKVEVRFFQVLSEFFKGKAKDKRGNLTSMQRLACGIGAGLSEEVFAVAPVKTIKVKFFHDQGQQNPKFKDLSMALAASSRTTKFRGIYKGVTATMIKQGSKQAIRFFVMKTLKFSSVIENFFSDTLLLNSQFQDWYRGGSLFLSLLYILREVLLVSVPSVVSI